MCLRLTKKSEYLIADKPIVVFKNGSVNFNEFSSKCYYFHYIKEVIAPKVTLTDEWGVVEEGYHSYCSVLASLFSAGESHIFGIPKGAKYIKGRFEGVDSIASDSIVWIGSIWNLKNWNKAFNFGL